MMSNQASLYCQRWRDHRSSYRPAREVINPNQFDVAPIDLTTAKTFCLQHHYAGASYPACRFRYGLFQHGQLAGVAVFSHPMSNKVLTNVFPGNPLDSVELGRFVLLDQVLANGESWFFARCRELLRWQGLRGILAFSDDTKRSDLQGNITLAGHLGSQYQSTGASYLGRSSKRLLHLLPNGTVLSPRSISKIRKKTRGWHYASQLLVKAGAVQPGDNEDLTLWLNQWLPRITRPLPHAGNHRYAWAIQPGVIPVGTSFPYPKNFPTARDLPLLKE